MCISQSEINLFNKLILSSKISYSDELISLLLSSSSISFNPKSFCIVINSFSILNKLSKFLTLLSTNAFRISVIFFNFDIVLSSNSAFIIGLITVKVSMLLILSTSLKLFNILERLFNSFFINLINLLTDSYVVKLLYLKISLNTPSNLSDFNLSIFPLIDDKDESILFLKSSKNCKICSFLYIPNGISNNPSKYCCALTLLSLDPLLSLNLSNAFFLTFSLVFIK